MSRPSTVSSATLVRYSCARWIGFRVWKPTTRRQPRSANSARVSAIHRELGEGRLGPVEDRDAPGEVERMLRVEPRDAGVGVVGRAEAVLGLALLVVLVDLLDLEHGQRAALLVGEDDAVTLRSLVDRQADRQRPGQAAGEPHLLDDALVVLLVHEPLERRERAGGKHVEVGNLAGRERDDLETREIVRALAGAVD